MEQVENQLFAREREWVGDIGIYLIQKHHATARKFRPVDVEWEEIKEVGEWGPDFPLITLTRGEANQLMGQLWNMGIRPERYEPDQNLIAAKNAHIENAELNASRFHELVLKILGPIVDGMKGNVK